MFWVMGSSRYLALQQLYVYDCVTEDDVKRVMKKFTDFEGFVLKVPASIEASRKEVVKVVESHDKKTKKETEYKAKKD